MSRTITLQPIASPKPLDFALTGTFRACHLERIGNHRHDLRPVLIDALNMLGDAMALSFPQLKLVGFPVKP